MIADPAATITLVNADLGAGQLSSLRISGSRICAPEATPADAGQVVDLRGDRVLPGLINAHDHLQLNNFPQLRYPVHFRNAGEWVADFNTRLRGDSAVRASASLPRTRRLFTGGLKNLLSGVTTVAHHDPMTGLPLLNFPTRVVAHFGWSHSLGIDGDEAVRASSARTPAEHPWIIHAAEGIDAQSAAEFTRLEELGCLRANTLLVHGIALDATQRRRLREAGAGLIWCPSSNLRLFGQTAQVADLLTGGHVALGSDSRLTASGDLLDEVRIARECLAIDEPTLERIVTSDSARLLRLAGAGTLCPGAPADLVVLPAGTALSRVRRCELRLVMRGGVGLYADGDYAAALGARAEWGEVRVDGVAKWLHSTLAALVASGEVSEPGVSVHASGGRAACA